MWIWILGAVSAGENGEAGDLAPGNEGTENEAVSVGGRAVQNVQKTACGLLLPGMQHPCFEGLRPYCLGTDNKYERRKK